MFSTGSKFFFGITLFGALSFAVYMLLIDESAIGATALLGAVAATALLTALVLSTRDGEAGEAGVAATEDVPTSSMWPLITALGFVILLAGTVTTSAVFLLGVVVLLASLIEWTVLGWSERASSDKAYNASLRKRLLHPIEFPVIAAVGLGVIIVSFSQITLAISKDAGAIAFIVIGIAVLGAGVLFSLRPNLKRGIVIGISTLGAIGIVAAGIAGASAGVRDQLVEAKSEGHYTRQDCGAEKSKYFDKLPLEVVSSTSSVIATVEIMNGKLTARAQGIPGEQQSITIPRSNPSSVMFVNNDAEEHRLVANLGTKVISGDVKEDVVLCTQMIAEGAKQVLILNIPKPAVAGKPFTLTVPGLAGQSIEVIVP